jgi:membrane protease YdiL (CAAX protease family)
LFYFSSYFQLIPIYLFHISHSTPSINVLLSAFSSCILVIILFLIYRKDLKKEWKIFKEAPGEIMNTTFGYWFIGMIIMLISNTIIISLTGSSGAQNEKLVQSMIKSLPVIMLINAGLFAPFNEELVFRKSLHKIFKNKWLYITLSGAIFGFLHVVGTYSTPTDLLYIIPYGALGFMFALSYHETKTIFSTIFMHAIHNTVLIGLSILINFVL